MAGNFKAALEARVITSDPFENEDYQFKIEADGREYELTHGRNGNYECFSLYLNALELGSIVYTEVAIPPERDSSWGGGYREIRGHIFLGRTQIIADFTRRLGYDRDGRIGYSVKSSNKVEIIHPLDYLLRAVTSPSYSKK